MVKVNGIEIEKGRFPNNEKKYQIVPVKGTHWYEFEVIFESNEDLFDLLLYKKYIDSEQFKDVFCPLKIRFMPYGQSDREFDDQLSTFKYFARLINDANFDIVEIVDPHSPVMAATLNKSKIYYPALPKNDYDLYLYPDNGAAKKYSEIYDFPYIYGYKKRNLKTGEIIRYEIIADREDIEGKKILIVDDICMGGRTFKEAAKALNEMGAAQVDLHITHLMPQAKEFYENHKDFGITNFWSMNTLKQEWYGGSNNE